MASKSWRVIEEGEPIESTQDSGNKSKFRLIGDDEEPTNIAPKKKKADNKKKEYEFSDLGRIPANVASNIVAGFGAMPKNLAAGAQWAIETGSDIQDYLQDLGESPEQKEQNKLSRESIAKTTGMPFQTLARQATEALPEEEAIKNQFKEKLPEGFMEPKGIGEKYLYDAASSLGSLLFPLSPAFKLNAKKDLLLSVGPKVARYLGHKISGSEKGGDAIELGTTLGIMYGLGPSFKKINKEDYDALRVDAAEKGIDMDLPDKLKESFHKFYKQITEAGGVAIPSNKYLIKDVMPQWEPYFNNDKLPFSEFMEFVQRGNDVAKELPFFSRSRAQLGEFLKEVKGVIKTASKGNGKAAPFAKRLLHNNQMYSSIQSAQEVVNFLKNNKLASGLVTGTILGPMILGHKTIEDQAPYIAGAAAFSGGAIGLNRVYSYLKHPAVRKEVANVLKDALHQDSGAAVKHLHKLVKAEKEVKGKSKKREYILDSNESGKPLEYILD